MGDYLDWSGLQTFKQQNDLAYGFPVVQVKPYYNMWGSTTPSGTYFNEFYHIDLSSVKNGCMFMFVPASSMGYWLDYSYDNGMLPLYSGVGNFGTCGGNEIAEPQGDYIELTVTGYIGPHDSMRHIPLEAGVYYLARKDNATKVTVYLTGSQLPYHKNGSAIFAQDETGGLYTIGWNTSDLNYNGSEGALCFRNGTIYVSGSTLPYLDAPPDYYANKYIGVTSSGAYDFIDLPIPQPTTANNGKILGVVNGKLAYIDPPTSSTLANVTEAIF